MYMLYVTLNATATPIIPQGGAPFQMSAPFQTLVISPAAHAITVGDSKVSATQGIQIPALGSPLVIPTVSLTQNLNGWYLFGTAADVVSILVLE